ncbi:MAG: 50S ribosomal protein L22 [Patescibacteria group bacterium]|jgi:large subunit ribosomal protein L22
MIEVKAKLFKITISAKKMRLVADTVRGKSVDQAESILTVLPKRSAPVLLKLLRSAIANAKDRYELNVEDLMVKSVMVNEGMATKRWRPTAFGRAHAFKKHSCQVILTLTLKAGAKAQARDKKSEPVETVDLTKVDKKTDIKEAPIKDVKKSKNPLKRIKDNQNPDHKAKGIRQKTG